MIGHGIASDSPCADTEVNTGIDGRLLCRHYYVLLQNPTKLNFAKLALEYIPGAACELCFNWILPHKSQLMQSAL